MINVKNLSNPMLVRRLYELYYLGSADSENLLSSHWKDFSGKIKVRVGTDGNLTSFRGYGFGDLGATHIANKILKYLGDVACFINFSYKKDLLFLIKRARPLLRKFDSFLSCDSFRQVCSLAVIRRHLKVERDDEFNILVIGDGYGFLSALLKDVYPNARITLVDIGKVLFFQAVNLQRMHPHRSHYLFNDQRPAHAPDFRYVPAGNIWKTEPIEYKLIINIVSMQEMNYATIKNYFEFIRMNAIEDNLFYCCNRKSKTLTGGEIVEFARYPWQKEDRHFVDEICLFCKYFFSAKFPFFHRFDGPTMHRLTNVKIHRQRK